MTFAVHEIGEDRAIEAEAPVLRLPPSQARLAHARGRAVFVDLRMAQEMKRTGIIPGAFPCPHGLTDLWIGPGSPVSSTGPADEKIFVFCCGNGLHAPQAAQSARHMGLRQVFVLDGGMDAWLAGGGSVAALDQQQVH
ncbi:rhodanese-like domain-containing protein [Leisingera sp. McT4-56]|uniref:rhodanese-like domain-containing protein n=1 Tax=Leisingera sp. McT4-56 TaxID=2881255 RepID=UPI001CF8DF21|nr:rhodanese-like domain-containing protein [Leisingera sp. McT4-56]MCB4456451.1 rhodanese-like domain-containing protein [Leisingera sp. McT4-56]